MESTKISMGPTGFGTRPPDETQVYPGQSTAGLDCKSHGIPGSSERQFPKDFIGGVWRIPPGQI